MEITRSLFKATKLYFWLLVTALVTGLSWLSLRIILGAAVETTAWVAFVGFIAMMVVFLAAIWWAV